MPTINYGRMSIMVRLRMAWLFISKLPVMLMEDRLLFSLRQNEVRFR